MPLTILAVLSMIWLLTVFYSQTSLRCEIHLALRESAGISTGTVLPPEEAGFNGLYANLFQQEQFEELMLKQAWERIPSTAHTDKGLTLEAQYQGLKLPPVLRLQFQKKWRGWGLYPKGIQQEKSCWYYGLDEAQWIRNDDWIRSEVKK